MKFFLNIQRGIFITILLFLISCASEDVNINFISKFHAIDSTYKISINHSFKQDTLKFDDYQIKQLKVNYEINNIKYKQEIILPESKNINYYKPLLIVPSFQSSRLNYYSFISYLKDYNRPILIFSYRGTDKNSDLDVGTYSDDKTDLNIFLEVYKTYYKLDSIAPSVFASSYGALLFIDSQFDSSSVAFENVCLESMPINIKGTLSRMPYGDYIQNTKQFQIPDSNKVLSGIERLLGLKEKLMLVYGLSDDYILKSEIINLKERFEKLGVNFLLIPNAKHNIRKGFPLNQNEVDSLNNKIVNFLKK